MTVEIDLETLRVLRCTLIHCIDDANYAKAFGGIPLLRGLRTEVDTIISNADKTNSIPEVVQ